MGKGERGKAETSRETYGTPAAERSQNVSQQSGNIMYGSPSSGFRGTTTDQGKTFTPRATPSGYTQSQPRTQATPTQSQSGVAYPGDQSGRPNEYGYYNPPDSKGRLQGKDRVHEVYRWMVRNGASPQQAMAKDLYGGDSAYLQQLISQGGGESSIAFKGWEPRPNNVPSYFINQGGQWVDPTGGAGGRSIGAPGGHGMAPGGMQAFGGGVAGQALGDYGNIQGQLQNFATTGGYTPEDIANIRARAVSPIRSVYSSARRDLDRNQSLQGGYQPGRATALGRFAREQGQATADATTNVEGALAQMINQGKRFGLSGMSGMYGTSPGLASTFGNQALQAQQLENQMARGMTADQIQASQLPGAWETTLGRIGQIGGAMMPLV